MPTVRLKTRRDAKNGKSALPKLLDKLRQDHSSGELRAGLVAGWLRANSIPRRRLAADSSCRRLVDSAPAAAVDGISRRLGETQPGMTLKVLERAFEQILADRQTQGAVYTPDVVIDYLLIHAMESRDGNSRPPTICDPACGSGGFLARAAVLLAQRFGISLRRAIERHVVGIDVDPVAVEQARCLVELLLAHQDGRSRPIEPKVFARDSLLETPKQLGSAADVAGFDVVATNPPYVKLQNLAPAYRDALVDVYKPFIKGSFSLALLFLVAGLRLLAPGGRLAYITQNNLFTSLAGEPVRRHLQELGSLRRIVDFGHAHVFDGASAYTCLLFLGNEPTENFEFGSIPRAPSRDDLAQVQFSTIPTARLQPRKWRLAVRKHLDNLQRIETVGRPLGEIAHIRVGFATLCDAVFLVRGRKDGSVFATRPGGEPMEIEREATRGAVKIADLRSQNDLEDNFTRVIYPYEHDADALRVVPAETFASRYPRAWQYLCECRSLLDGRDKGKPNPDGWHAWGRAQSRLAPGPKLLTKTFDSQPRFMLDASDQLFCNGYAVSLKTAALHSQLTIEALQRIVNSRIMHYYARLTSFQIEGGYQCYQKNFIEPFGIPQFDEQEVAELPRLAVSEVDEMLAKRYQIKLRDIEEIVVKESS